MKCLICNKNLTFNYLVLHICKECVEEEGLDFPDLP